MSDAADDDLLAQLRQSVEASDPPPPSLRDSLIRASTWDRDLQKLATLTYDSSLAPSTMRGALARTITYEFDDLELSLSIAREDSFAVVSGIVIPPSHAEVEVLRPGTESETVMCDDFGRFSTRIDRTLFGLRVRTESAEFETGLISI